MSLVRFLGALLCAIILSQSASAQTPGPFIPGVQLPAAGLNAALAIKSDYPYLGPVNGVQFSGNPVKGYIPLAASSSAALWTYALPVYVTAFGADQTGTNDSTAAFVAATAAAAATVPGFGVATIYVPCGLYLIDSGVWAISVGNLAVVGEDRACVQLRHTNDNGPTLQISNAAGIISHISIRNVTFQDSHANLGTAGYSTCASSPYQLVADGVGDLLIENVDVYFGCGSISLSGVFDAHLRGIDLETFVIPGAPSETGLGTVLYIGSSANSNLAVAYSVVVIGDDIEVEAGRPSAGLSKAAVGVRIDGCDGCWLSNGHIQAAASADMRVANNSAKVMGNIYVRNWLWDITPGVGLLFNGTEQIMDSSFDGRVSSAGVFPAVNSPGISISGTGGMSGVELAIGVDGFGAEGILSTATNMTNVTVRPKNITNNNLIAGSHAGISFSEASNLSIVGGIVGSDGQVTPNISIGAGVSDAAINGVVANGSPGWGVVLTSGAANIVLTGNDLSGNMLGALTNGTSGATRYVGNLGLVDSLTPGPGYAIGSTLPTCNSGLEGARAFVTNGIASPTFLQAVSATGAAVDPVFCTGSAWVYG
jgi:hypothetical protein